MGTIVCFVFLLLCAMTASSHKLARCRSLHSPSNLWGSYLPGLHLGTRARNPKSLVSSVGWSTVDGSLFRHLSTDELEYSGWRNHDGEGYGVKTIIDNKVQVNITSTFITELTECITNNDSINEMVMHSHHMTTRFSKYKNIQTEQTDGDDTDPVVSIFASVGLADDDDQSRIECLGIWNSNTSNNIGWKKTKGDERTWIFLQGKSSDKLIGDVFVFIELEEFTEDVKASPSTFHYSSSHSDADNVWNLKGYIQREGKKSLARRDPKSGKILRPLVKDEITELFARPDVLLQLPPEFIDDKIDRVRMRLVDSEVDKILKNLHVLKQVPSDTAVVQKLKSLTGKKDGKMSVIQSIIQMSKTKHLSLNIDIFSLPENWDNSNSKQLQKKPTFLSRLGVESCSGKEETSSSSECLSDVKTFLLDFFDGHRTSWIAGKAEGRRHQFNTKVEEIFLPSSSLIDNYDVHDVAVYTVSNLLAGYGYFHGKLKVKVAEHFESELSTHHSTKTWNIDTLPISVYSGTPSPLRFPRPFLWDEGFHLSVMRLWDYHKFFDVLKSWFDLQFDAQTNNYLKSPLLPKNLDLSKWDGWIPREVAIGSLSQSVVPDSFLAQDTRIPSPPTLLLPLLDHLSLVEEVIAFLNCDSTDCQNQPSMKILRLLQSMNCKLPGRRHTLSETRTLEFMMRHCSVGNITFQQNEKKTSRLDYLHLSNFIQETYRFIDSYFNHMTKWFKYFNRTQKSNRLYKISGDEIPIYRWFQESPDHTFASGFDDSPRGLLTDFNSTHVDLQSWVSFMAKSILKICRFKYSRYSINVDHSLCQEWVLATEHSLKPFGISTGNSNQLETNNLTQDSSVFYNSLIGIYGDNIGRQPQSRSDPNIPMILPPWRTDGRCGDEFPSPMDPNFRGLCSPLTVNRCCSPSGWCGHTASYCQCPGCIVTPPLTSTKIWDQFFQVFLNDARSPHISYISLIPLALELLPINESVNPFTKLISYVSSEEHLLGYSGLRSLSKSDPLYHTGDNYWRGHVWMNINYLFLRSLKDHYIHLMSCDYLRPVNECQSLQGRELINLYYEIRKRLIRSITTEYKKHRTLFESYDDNNGEGRGSKLFTGWTSAFLLLIV